MLFKTYNIFLRYSTTIFIVALLTLTVFIFSCSNEKNILTDEEACSVFLLDKENELEKFLINLGDAYWRYYVLEGAPDLKENKTKIANFFYDKNLLIIIEHWKKKEVQIKDTLLKRRIEIWDRLRINAAINFDKDVLSLQGIIEQGLEQEMKESDTARQDMLEKKAIDLLKIRNKKAKKMGFSDYAVASVWLAGYDTLWYYKSVEMIDSMTLEKYKVLIEEERKILKVDKFHLSDVYLIYEKYANELEYPGLSKEKSMTVIKNTLRDMGIAFRLLPIKKFVETELMPPSTGQGIAVKIPDDFRIAVISEMTITAKFHEIGHGIDWMSRKAKTPILKGYEWMKGGYAPGFAEGAAEIFASITIKKEWLQRYLKYPEEIYSKKQEKLKKYFPAYMRYYLFQFMLENEMYKDPDQDMTAMMNRVLEKYLLTERPVKNGFPVANGMFISQPIYQHHWLFGEMMAWQIHEHLKKQFGEKYLQNKNTSSFLIETLYKDGEYYPWQKRLERATGKVLDVHTFLKEHME